MIPLDTPTYYSCSSILQADAAIIGIGIVVVVYKLQSLDGRAQLAFQLLRTLSHFDEEISPLVRQIHENSDPDSRGSALRQYLNKSYYGELEIIVTAPLRAGLIRSQAVRTLVFIAIQMILCAASIVSVPYLSALKNVTWLFVLCETIIVYFGGVIGLIVAFAREIIPNSNEFDLKALSPRIYQIAHS
jgi:hypothetical protein